MRCAELAWLLGELCAVGIRCRAAGWCLGELRAEEVHWGPSGLRRSPVVRRSARRRRARHLRCGHDDGCRALGVPSGTLRRLLTTWGGADAGALLEDAVEEAVAELSPGTDWAAEAAAELVAYTIRSRITPVRPSTAQIPRSASNWAFSRRFLTWSRKRAASAPSMVR